jgi:hypothetical protein
MGGISFYKQNGEHVARQAGGPDRARILNDPGFARTRENMSEFGGLNLAAGSFSRIFTGVKNLRDTTLRGRVSRIFRVMMKQDEDAARGQRGVLVSQHRSDLLWLELNGARPFKTSVGARFTVAHSEDRKTATFTIADLRVESMITAPTGTTHFQFVQLVGVLADVVFNEQTKRYESSSTELQSVNNFTFSDYIPLGSVDPVPVNLETVLPVDVTGQVSVVQAVGILFFTKNGTAYYPSQQGKGMQIVDVY